MTSQPVTPDGLPGWVADPDDPYWWILVGGTDENGGDVSLRGVHPVETCRQPCTIHAPTAHHMRGWPIVWDRWALAQWRACPHARWTPQPGRDDWAHPDPDELSMAGRPHAGCDGCCLLTDTLSWHGMRLHLDPAAGTVRDFDGGRIPDPLPVETFVAGLPGLGWDPAVAGTLFRWITGRCAVHGIVLDQDLLDEVGVQLALGGIGESL